MSITAGTGIGQSRTITGISGFQLTVDEDWDTIPDATSVWSLNAGQFGIWPESGDVGYWTENDSMVQSMVWVKTASGKQAIVAFVTFATGRQFYGHIPNHPVKESGRHEIWLIDPADLAAVAQGTKTNYTVEPYERIPFEFPWVTYPLGVNDITIAEGGRQATGGVTLNADHTRMYVNYIGGYWGGFSDKPIIAGFDIAP